MIDFSKGGHTDMSSQNNPLYSNDPQDVVESFYQLKQTVASLEGAQGQVPGYFRREFAINGLPIKQSSFKDIPEVRCVEYVTHGSVDQGLPRQVRYGYRPSNGYSEALTYRDSYWTVDGEVSHCIEFNATSRGVLKRSEVVSRNGEVLRKDVTHVQLGQKRH